MDVQATTLRADDEPQVTKAPREKDRDFIGRALERWKLAADAEQTIRDEALDDMRFVAGEQWPDQVRKERDQDRRPCLTVNRLPQVLNQVCNEQRQQRPAVQVDPIGDGADTETAKILEGLSRHIDSNSNSDVATDGAFEAMCIGGFGYFRYVCEYVNDRSFNQEIRCKRILNPFSVYFDPNCAEPDYSDANWAFVVEDMSREAYRLKYPDSELAGLNEITSTGDVPPDWAATDTVRVAEYFWVETETKTLCLLKSGKKAFSDKLPKGEKVVKRRSVEVRSVKWALINAVEILEQQDWPGKYIPIVPVLGTEMIIEGKRHLFGVVRHAKDPQRMLNYWVSAQTEMIALAPKAPYMVAEGQIEGYEDEYKQANTRNLAVLTYKKVSLGNQMAPPPLRQVAEPPIQAISVAINQSSADIKATTGLYDASLGAPGAEHSGKAILARQQEGNTANLHLSDNLTRSIRFAGRIKLDLIRYIYDVDQVIHIIQPDQTRKQVTINRPFFEAGVQKLYDLTVGEYDVNVTVGPSFASKRQEAVESILGLVKAAPELMQVVGDLLVKNMDWPEADAIAERLHKMLPPQLQDSDPNQQPVPPAIAQKLQASLQMIDQLSALVHKFKDEIDTKSVECASRERIAAMQEETKRTLGIAALDAKDGITLLMEEVGAVKHRHALAVQQATAQQTQQADAQSQSADQQHQAGMQAADQQHQAGMQQQAQQADQQAQASDQQHQAGMQASDQEAAAAQAEQAAANAPQGSSK